MRTRLLLPLALEVAMILTPSTGSGQAQVKVWRVGFLAPAGRQEVYRGLIERLHELGYVEGKNLVVEWRDADGNYERLPELAAELVKFPVDVLITHGVPGTVAAMKATRTIPVVFMTGGAVVGTLIDSLSHPGRNATGMSVLLQDLCAKQLELVARIVPGLSRVAVLTNPANRGHAAQLENLRRVGRAAVLEILPVQARTSAEIREALSRVTRERAGALMFIADPFLDQQMRQIADLCVLNRVPSATWNSRYAEAGGLLTYGSDEKEIWRHLATFVDKILKGANPGDLPVEQPTKFELAINRKTAKALGLTIPPDLLIQADKVID